jgi:hypothetical protein
MVNHKRKRNATSNSQNTNKDTSKSKRVDGIKNTSNNSTQFPQNYQQGQQVPIKKILSHGTVTTQIKARPKTGPLPNIQTPNEIQQTLIKMKNLTISKLSKPPLHPISSKSSTTASTKPISSQQRVNFFKNKSTKK